MDTRQKNRQSDILQSNSSDSRTSQKQIKIENEEQLNDSIIYNIMKKIEYRQSLIQQYKKQKQEQNKTFITKYVLHSNMPLYYASGVIFAKAYRFTILKNPTLHQIVSLPNFLFHICVILSINEYGKYRNIFGQNQQNSQQYRIHQNNVENLMNQKIKRFSILNRITKTKFLNQQKLTKIFKYRMVV